MPLQSATDLRSSENYPVWHPFTPLMGGMPELEVVAAKGASLFLSDGREIIDAVSSWWVNLHGHAHPVIAEAIAQQAKTLEHVIFAGFTHQPAVQLAYELLEILPKGYSKVFYSDNGSTAIEVALKMALQYWHNLCEPRKLIVALSGAYHGDTFGAMSVAERNTFTTPFNPLLFDVATLTITPTQDINLPLDQADEITIAQFRKLVETEKPAAFIFEPLVQGSAGMRFYKLNLLKALLSIAKENNIITIADEVMTGFGRTGPLFASQYLENDYLDLVPDLICLSKGLTGGFLPLGATVCKPFVQEAFRKQQIEATFFHGHSYTANPLACAAALASIKLLKSDESKADRFLLAERLQAFLVELKQMPKVANCRQLGGILVIEFSSANPTDYFNEARHHLYQWCIERNVLLRPLGNVIYILPPYCITEVELEKVFGVLRELLDI